MNTPLQNGFGHIYGPGKTAVTDGAFPVWLDQVGSRIMGGIIDLQFDYGSGIKVASLYPSAIRTGTPCMRKETGVYVPIPTFKVVNDVSAEETKVILAAWDGCALPIANITLVHPDSPEKAVKLTGSNLKKNEDGSFTLTISGNTFGVMKAGDCLILKEAAGWAVEGLTKSNLEYAGADPTSKLNITLVDAGRILASTAPALPKKMRATIQTIKYEED